MIYFIQSGNNGPIKIGFTRNIKKRLKSLQGMNPEKLKLLYTMNGIEKTEKCIQKIFSRFCIHHEWFRPTKRLLLFVKNPQYLKQLLIKNKPPRNNKKHFGRPKGLNKSKLDPFKKEIIALLKIGTRRIDIAHKYNVTPTTIANWLKKNKRKDKRKLWKWNYKNS